MECKNKKTCGEFFRRGTAACAKCCLSDKQDGEPEEEFDDNVDADGVGDSDEEDDETVQTDEFGNDGARFYSVTLDVTRTEYAQVTYRVAADSPEKAEANALDAWDGADPDEEDWSEPKYDADCSEVEED